ncbi:hypothetical protein [Roseivivax sp. CAU 1761]
MTEVLLTAKASFTDETVVSSKSASEFWLDLGCDPPRESCVFCGHSLQYGGSAEDELSVHPGCVDGLRQLKQFLHETAVSRVSSSSSSRTVGEADEGAASETAAHEAGGFRERGVKPHSNPSAADLLSIFDGEEIAAHLEGAQVDAPALKG